MQEKIAKLNTDANDEAMKALDEIQTKKLPAILKSATLFSNVGFPVETLPEVKLSKTQTEELNALVEKMAKSAPKPSENGDFQGMMQAMRKHRDETTAAAMKLVTPAQKATIDAYKKAHPPRQFRGGFGGPGGPPGGGGAPPPPPGQ